MKPSENFHNAVDEAAYWRHLALTDELTGLPNRRALIEQLKDMLRSDTPATPSDRRGTSRGGDRRHPDNNVVALGFIDLDGFKATNDTHGHQVGDDVLKEVAKFLKDVLKLRNKDQLGYAGAIRDDEMAGRLGGDEFVFILQGTTAQLMTQRIADINATLNMLSINHIKPDGDEITVSIRGSVGVINCDRNLSAEENLSRADEAMYANKQARKQAAATTAAIAQNQADAARFQQIIQQLDTNPPPEFSP